MLSYKIVVLGMRTKKRTIDTNLLSFVIKCLERCKMILIIHIQLYLCPLRIVMFVELINACFVFSTSDRYLSDVLLLSKVRFSDIFKSASNVQLSDWLRMYI